MARAVSRAPTAMLIARIGKKATKTASTFIRRQPPHLKHAPKHSNMAMEIVTVNPIQKRIGASAISKSVKKYLTGQQQYLTF